MSEINSSGNPESDSALPSEAEERRIQAIVERFLEDLQSEESVDRAALEAQFPELAPYLGRRLRFVEEVARAAAESFSEVSSSQHVAAAANAASNAASSEATMSLRPSGDVDLSRERSHRMRCPHCGNVVQVVSLETIEVTCRDCGSTFRLDSGRAWVFGAAPRPRRIGPYEVRDVVGRGAFGLVYRAVDPTLSRDVAIKIPRLGYFESDDEKLRFFREARAAARLRHGNIVRVYEIDQEGDTPYIVSEYIDGRTLDDWCGGQRLSFREASDLVQRVAEALHYAHTQGVVHRDVKPSNILLNSARQPFLTDFGLARRDEGEITMTLDGEILGTPAYMSPEQAEGRHQEVDARSDVFSLGVVLYRLLTGELPFRGNRRMTITQVIQTDPTAPRWINDRIPRDLETITLKAMAKDPARRYESAHAMAEDLRRWLTGDPILARPETRLEKGRRWCRRNPWIAGLAASLVIVLTASSAGGITWAWHASVLHGIAERAYRGEREARAVADENARSARENFEQALVNQAAREADFNPSGSLVLSSEAWQAGGSDSRREQAHRLRVALWLSQFPKPARVWSPGASLLTAATSADGRHVVAALNNGTAVVWETQTGRRIASLAHGVPLFHVAISPNGQRVATAGRDKIARLWDVATGRAIDPPMLHTDWVRRVVFSPDGQWLVTGCQDGAVRLWNAETAVEATEPLARQPLGILDLAFSHDSRRLVSTYGVRVNEPGAAQIWDVATGKAVGPALQHERAVLKAAFSPDGKLVATAGDDHRVRLWNVESGEPIANADNLRHEGPVVSVRFSSDGQLLLTAGLDHHVRVWDVEQRRAAQPAWQVDFVPLEVAISADNKYAAVGGNGERIEIRELKSGRRVAPILSHAQPLAGLSFLPNGQRVVVASSEGTVKLFDLASDARAWPRWNHPSPIRGAAVVDNDSAIVVGCEDGVIQHLDRTTLNPLGDPLRQPVGVISLLAGRSSKLMATLGADRQLRIWDRSQGALPGGQAASPDGVDRVALHAPSESLLAVSVGGIARVQNARTGQLISSATIGHPVFTVVFSPDGQWFATGGDSFADGGKGPRVWNTATGTGVTPPLEHPGMIYGLAFHPQGKMLATAGSDNSVRLWELPSGRELGVLTHEGNVMRVAFDASGRLLATTCGDGVAMVWDVATGQRACRPMRHTRRFVHDAIFDPSSSILVTAASVIGTSSSDQPPAEVRLWEASTGDSLGPPLMLDGRATSLQITRDGRTLVIACEDGSVRAVPLVVPADATDHLRQVAELVAGQRYDANAGGLVPLIPAEQLARYEYASAHWPASITPAR